MGTEKKTHVNTEKEKAAIRKTLVAVPVIVLVLLGLVLVFYSGFLSPNSSSSSDAERALWLSVIPGSTWTYSDSTIEESLMPVNLKKGLSVEIDSLGVLDDSGNYVYTVQVKKSTSTIVGTFVFTPQSEGVLIFGQNTYSVHFSDQSSQSYDSSLYLMRITVPDAGCIDYVFVS